MSRCNPQSCESEEAIEHKQFIAELVFEMVDRKCVEQVAQDWRQYSDEWYESTSWLVLGEHTESVESEQRAIGITHQSVYEVYHAA